MMLDLGAEEILELDQAIDAERARRSLSEFVRQGWEVLEPGVELEWNWHIGFVCDHVQAVLEDWMRKQDDSSYQQRARNLLINIPPGTAKSRIVSVFAPAWMWLHWPSWRVLCISANPEVAIRDADYSRQVIESEWYRDSFGPEWKLRRDQDAKSNFGNSVNGQRTSRGISAKITGMRYDAIIVDDPNDLKEIHRDTIRKGVNSDWDNAIANRVSDLRTSVRIGIMQRAHEEDWSGHVLEGGGWEHVSLPMEYEPGRDVETFLGRRDPRTEPGEVLHPARFTQQVLEDERRRLGSVGYAGQMQQRPAPAEGSLIKRHWLKVIDSMPTPSQCLISVDASLKKTQDGSRCSILVIGRDGAATYVMDNDTRPMEFVELRDAIVAMRAKWPSATRIIVEDKANGPAVVNALKNTLSGIREVSPGQDSKEGRVAAVSPEIEAGQVHVVRDWWTTDFIDELAVFPAGKHDDQVDALTQALLFFAANPKMQEFLAAFG